MRKQASWNSHKIVINPVYGANKDPVFGAAKQWQGFEELVYVSSFEKEDLTVVRITLWRRIPEGLAWIEAFDTLWLPSHLTVPWHWDSLNWHTAPNRLKSANFFFRRGEWPDRQDTGNLSWQEDQKQASTCSISDTSWCQIREWKWSLILINLGWTSGLRNVCGGKKNNNLELLSLLLPPDTIPTFQFQSRNDEWCFPLFILHFNNILSHKKENKLQLTPSKINKTS